MAALRALTTEDLALIECFVPRLYDSFISFFSISLPPLGVLQNRAGKVLPAAKPRTIAYLTGFFTCVGPISPRICLTAS